MGAKTNQVRIIGGRWRGRKLAFPDLDGLRPTADRIRETLFNWLAPVVPGSKCLDLFAGSGALGFEAASRGAGRVVMVDRDHRVVDALKNMQQLLSAGSVELVCDDATHYLAHQRDTFDIVFLDPPFADGGLLQAAISSIQVSGALNAGGYVYLETAKADALPELPEGWALCREKQAGHVSYRLLSYAPDGQQG